MNQNVTNIDTAYAKVKYRGDVAAGYDQKRVDTEKWKSEQKILSDIIASLPEDTVALDVPCGTGRLAELFKRFRPKGYVIGMDVNREMSDQARAKGMKVRYGDIIYIPAGDKSFDVSFCIRLLNWIGEDDVGRALSELQRVSRKKIIFTLRVAEHTRARPLSLVEAALDGWKIAANQEITGTFRMITLESTA